jgi:hypothetical protein
MINSSFWFITRRAVFIGDILKHPVASIFRVDENARAGRWNQQGGSNTSANKHNTPGNDQKS